MSNASQSGEFEFSTRLGLVFVAQAFGISGLAVAGLLLYIGYSFATVKRGAHRNWSTVTHVHYYFLSLLVSELIQAIGGLMDIKWVAEARVTGGSFCTTQGVLKNMGDVGVAFAELAIAIHTFAILVCRWRPDPSRRLALTMVSLIWLFLFLIQIVVLASHKKHYYGDTQFWCWITSAYAGERIGLEYAWMWIAALLNIVLYIPLALVISGHIVVTGWRVSIPRAEDRINLRSSSSGSSTGKETNSVAMQMLFYPIVYTITVLPVAIVRWSAFFHSAHVPFYATALSDGIFATSGLLNVILFTLTRPTLVPRRRLRAESTYTIGPFTSQSSMGQGRRAHGRSDEEASGAWADDSSDWRAGEGGVGGEPSSPSDKRSFATVPPKSPRSLMSTAPPPPSQLPPSAPPRRISLLPVSPLMPLPPTHLSP